MLLPDDALREAPMRERPWERAQELDDAVEDCPGPNWAHLDAAAEAEDPYGLRDRTVGGGPDSPARPAAGPGPGGGAGQRGVGGGGAERGGEDGRGVGGVRRGEGGLARAEMQMAEAPPSASPYVPPPAPPRGAAFDGSSGRGALPQGVAYDGFLARLGGLGRGAL